MQVGTGMVLCCGKQPLELRQSQDSSTPDNYARTDLGNITTGQQPYTVRPKTASHALYAASNVHLDRLLQANVRACTW